MYTMISYYILKSQGWHSNAKTPNQRPGNAPGPAFRGRSSQVEALTELAAEDAPPPAEGAEAPALVVRKVPQREGRMEGVCW